MIFLHEDLWSHQPQQIKHLSKLMTWAGLTVNVLGVKKEHVLWPYQGSMTEVHTDPLKWPKINHSLLQPWFPHSSRVLAVPLAAEGGLGQREGDEIMFPWHWCTEQGVWQTPTGCMWKSCSRLLFLVSPVHFSAPNQPLTLRSIIRCRAAWIGYQPRGSWPLATANK